MHVDRDELIRAKINDLGRKSFPDDPDVLWHVRSILHANNYSFVEAEPTPATVGYPRLMFVLSFAFGAEPAVVGCYGFERGLWSLLFTTPNTPADWVGLFPAAESAGGMALDLEAALLPLLGQVKNIQAIQVYRATTGDGSGGA